MTGNRGVSIIFPEGSFEKCRELSDVAVHDLGLDEICRNLSDKPKEQGLLLDIMRRISDNPDIIRFRLDVFEDILKNPDFRYRMLEILDKIDFLKDYGSFRRDHEESSGTWDLVHRLEELRDYVSYVEALRDCLGGADLKSGGLGELKAYIDGIYRDNGFKELKQDISELKANTSNLKSVTVGINLNERFEAKEIGLISINSKAFTGSTILRNFGNLMVKKDSINESTEWDGSSRFQQFSTTDGTDDSKIMGLAKTKMMIDNPLLMMSMARVSDGDMARDVTSHMDRISDHMLGRTVKKLKDVLHKYVGLSILNITSLIPEFLYYVRWAEYVKRHMDSGFSFCKAFVLDKGGARMKARGFYNLKLADSVADGSSAIVTNDLDFGSGQDVFILTGANRGGKTTVTQAVGIMYVLAQGGIFVPASEFAFAPVDCIYTHFPADEDKTMDLGRLGEECKRFREMFSECTKDSLMLLNETFSTTSFEEGFYIARDAVKAVLTKGTRCIYNTHMHKLASVVDELNKEVAPEGSTYRAASLIAVSDGRQRSFKVKVAPPQGMSYARDIAEKYGVTYEMLVDKEK